MGGEAIREALERAATFFAERETRAGILGRRLTGHTRPDDKDLAEHLIRELRRRTRIDGSIGGSLVDTAWAAWELMDLGCAEDCAGLVRVLGYLLAQQDKPGHFAEGCSPERHAARRCHHAMQGFFSPGGRDESLAPVTLPTGATFADEEEARLAASCLALRSVLRAGEDRREAVRRHIASLLDSDLVAGAWSAGNPDLPFLVIGAAGHGPMKTRTRLGPLLDETLAHQGGDGTWPNAHTFHALAMLARLTDPRIGQVASTIAGHLCALQHPSGAFDPTGNEEWALVSTRTLTVAHTPYA
jgi:hypothetical protein